MGDAIWTRLTVFLPDAAEEPAQQLEQLLGLLDSVFEDVYEEGPVADGSREGVPTLRQRSWGGITSWGVSDLRGLWDNAAGVHVDGIKELIRLEVGFVASHEAKYDNAASAIFWRPSWPVIVERDCDQDGTPFISTERLTRFIKEATDLEELKVRVEAYLEPWLHGPLEGID